MKKMLSVAITAIALSFGVAHADTKVSVQKTPQSREASSPAVCLPRVTPAPRPEQAPPACNPEPCDVCAATYDSCIANCGSDPTCQNNCDVMFSFCANCCY